MEKIYTFITNKKTYAPQEMQKQYAFVESDVNYTPSLVEKIIQGGVNRGLLSNLNRNLTTFSGKYLTYGN